MSQENLELIRRGAPLLRRMLDGEDVSAEELSEFVAPDVVCDTLPGDFYGIDGFKAWVRELRATFGNLPWVAQEMIDAGELGVLVISTARIRGKLEGNWYEHELPNLYEVHDGKIVKVTSFPSKTEALTHVERAS